MFTQLQQPQIHVATMQTLQHKAIFAKKVSITVILIFENYENKTTQIECLTVNAKTAQMKKEKVMGQS